MEKVYDIGNNERVSVGVFPSANGSYIAMTFTKSKEFKTRKGAEKWLSKFVRI